VPFTGAGLPPVSNSGRSPAPSPAVASHHCRPVARTGRRPAAPLRPPEPVRPRRGRIPARGPGRLSPRPGRASARSPGMYARPAGL